MTTTTERLGNDTEALHEAGKPVIHATAAGHGTESVEVTGYAGAQSIYRDLGWRGVLPLPPRSKASPPRGYTGRGGGWPTEDVIDTWMDDYPADANLCLRLDGDTVGIDVDAYDQKGGARTLEEAEKRWGALPPTVSASSRSDGISGIRLFRVPSGTVLRDRVDFADLGLGDIEVLQRHHRYVVCWPSVHPTTNQRYLWRSADGAVLATPPSPQHLPELPEAWVTGLRADAPIVRGESRTSQVRKGVRSYESIDSVTGGQLSPKVAQRLGEALYDLDQGRSRHDAVLGHAMALLRHGNNGETGVDFALSTLCTQFVHSVGPDRPGGETEAGAEFERMISNAGHLLGDPVAPAQPVHVRRAEHLRDNLLSVDQLRTLPPVKPLIGGLLYRDTLAQLSGPPGSYKSFAVTAMSCAVASGEPFGVFRVPQAATVVYVAAEGSNSLMTRILAWCEVNGIDSELLNDRLRVLPLPVQLGNTVDVSQAVELVQEIDADLLVLDTRARCTVGLDENSATEQGKAIDAAETIRAAAGCTVLGVHHSSRSGTAGRGSNAWDGAVWSDLRMDGKALQAAITCAKHKDVPSGCVHHFTLTQHTVSACLMPGTLEPERETLVLSGNPPGIATVGSRSQEVVLEIIRKCAPGEGLTGPQLVEFARDQDLKKTAVYEALKRLVEEGHLVRVGPASRSHYVAGGGAL